MSNVDSRTAAEVMAQVRLRKPDRQQVRMVMGCDDELIGPNHPVRRIWDVTGHLDLSAFAAPIKAVLGNVGRDSTDPRLMVALWLYACIRNIGSARELDRRCKESAPFRWLCGGVSLNYHTLSDFRTQFADALDELFTRLVATLVERKVVKVKRIAQDGTRVRASAGAASYRREERLNQLLEQARTHVATLRQQLDDPAQSAALGARKAKARARAARQRVERLEQAVAQLPELKRKQEEAATKAGNGKVGQKRREKQPRVSTTDPTTRVLKMPDGGFRPAVNVQLATDTDSRAIVGVDVCNEGADSADLSEPMRRQVEERTGQKVEEHLIDGGYCKHDDIRDAHGEAVALYVPPKPARTDATRGKELEPKPGDDAAILDWKHRMASDEGKTIYKQRASTIETVNADLKTHRGLTPLTVRTLPKIKCVALWCALAYNIMHFATALMS